MSSIPPNEQAQDYTLTQDDWDLLTDEVIQADYVTTDWNWADLFEWASEDTDRGRRARLLLKALLDILRLLRGS